MAYRDTRGYLYVFENGLPRQLESQPVKEFGSGGPYAAYINSANNLIVYYNNEKTELGDATNTAFDFTTEIMLYKRDDVLAVYNRGKLERLSYFIKEFQAKGGLVAFRDQNASILKVYYNGQVTELELTTLGTPGVYVAGKNTVAFVNSSQYFKVFHEGEIYELDNIAPVNVTAGKDVVAYTDGINRSLMAFYNGRALTLEQIEPRSFQVGDGIIAYETDEGYFKIFNNGKLLKAESFAPEFYAVNDNTVLFFAENKLQIIQNGVRTVLDQLMPLSYRLDQDCIAWQDASRRLYLFADGKIHQVTTESFTDYTLNGNILSYDTPDGRTKIFHNGKIF